MSASHEYRGRRAAIVENDALRVTALEEGGHIAEIFDKRSGVNPLWTPPWASIEPSTYSPARHPEYGDGSDAMLLAGIMGHNLCVDIFGGPSDAEAAAGLTPHGEASVVRYELGVSGSDDDDGGRVAARGASCRTRDRAGRSDGEDSRDRREPDRVRSTDRLDPARHARPAVPREGAAPSSAPPRHGRKSSSARSASPTTSPWVRCSTGRWRRAPMEASPTCDGSRTRARRARTPRI